MLKKRLKFMENSGFAYSTNQIKSNSRIHQTCFLLTTLSFLQRELPTAETMIPFIMKQTMWPLNQIWSHFAYQRINFFYLNISYVYHCLWRVFTLRLDSSIQTGDYSHIFYSDSLLVQYLHYLSSISILKVSRKNFHTVVVSDMKSHKLYQIDHIKSWMNIQK